MCPRADFQKFHRFQKKQNICALNFMLEVLHFYVRPTQNHYLFNWKLNTNSYGFLHFQKKTVFEIQCIFIKCMLSYIDVFGRFFVNVLYIYMKKYNYGNIGFLEIHRIPLSFFCFYWFHIYVDVFIYVNRQTDKQTDRQTDRQIDRQTDRRILGGFSLFFAHGRFGNLAF